MAPAVGPHTGWFDMADFNSLTTMLCSKLEIKWSEVEWGTAETGRVTHIIVCR
jgi:hypothetical protein